MTSFYETVGGEPLFRELVDHFYSAVEDDAVLRPLYLDEDLGPGGAARDRLTMFLIQYWGGPTTYSDLRGHPRLRMRHGGWRITTRERDAWLSHMMAALAQVDVPEPERSELREYLEHAAHALVNAPD
ncbi:MAG: globin [Actinobacteria bacterium]|nr:globin [Actinomycetota bacterium]MCA1721412.1 globin [Actinomycetota bacterium]